MLFLIRVAIYNIQYIFLFPLIGFFSIALFSTLDYVVNLWKNVKGRDEEIISTEELQFQLLQACHFCELEGVRAKINAMKARGASVDFRTERNQSALMVLASTSRFVEECGDEVLSAGVDINGRGSKGTTPLIAAAHQGNLVFLKWAIERGADASLVNRSGHLPIHGAAINGRLACAQFLLDNFPECADAPDRFDRTPFLYAAFNGHSAVMELLARTSGVDFSKRDAEGDGALHKIAMFGNFRPLLLLRRLGSAKLTGPSTANKAGASPLRVAVGRGHGRWVAKACQLLRDGGSDEDQEELDEALDELVFYFMASSSANEASRQNDYPTLAMIRKTATQLIDDGFADQLLHRFLLLLTGPPDCKASPPFVGCWQSSRLTEELVDLFSSYLGRENLLRLLSHHFKPYLRALLDMLVNSDQSTTSGIASIPSAIQLIRWYYVACRWNKTASSDQANSPYSLSAFLALMETHVAKLRWIMHAGAAGAAAGEKHDSLATKMRTPVFAAGSDSSISRNNQDDTRDHNIQEEINDDVTTNNHPVYLIADTVEQKPPGGRSEPRTTSICLDESSPRSQSNSSSTGPATTASAPPVLSADAQPPSTSSSLLLTSFDFILMHRQLRLLFVDQVRALSFERKRDWLRKTLAKQQQQSRATLASATSSSSAAQSPSSSDPDSADTDSLSTSFIVNRTNVLTDARCVLLNRQVDALKSPFEVRFKNELGVGAGVTREWFQLMSQELFNEDCALFHRAADGVCLQPNPVSGINEDHLAYFRLAGRVVGMAVFHGFLLDVQFTPVFCKQLVGEPVSLDDLASVDKSMHSSLQWVLQNKLSTDDNDDDGDDDNDGVDLGLVFSADSRAFGASQTVDLIPGGSTVAVTESNKRQYVQLMAAHVTSDSIRPQLTAFLDGFHTLIDPDLAAAFTAGELQLLISGSPQISVDDWRQHTDYSGGYTDKSPQITWFWETVRQLGTNDRALVVQFATGSARVPVGGFANLIGVHGPQRFNIARVPLDTDSANRIFLPTSSTCFNVLRLPEYNTRDQLKQSLMTAIRCGTMGFSFG